MPIKLNTASGGGVILTGANTTSDKTITVPAVDATMLTDSSGVLNIGSGQVYKDASGNVGIGTSSPATKLEVASPASTSAVFRLASNKTGSGAGDRCRFDAYSADNSGVAYQLGFIDFDRADGTGTSSYMAINTRVSGTVAERARIDSSGNFIVATGGSSITAGGGTPRFSMNYSSNTGPGYTIQDTNPQNGNTFIRFVNAGTVAGQITTNGGTTTSYSSASDYRLKENVQPMTGALAKVSELKPCTYTWKADGLDGQGFIAHELQAVVPDAVVGEKDAVDTNGNPVYQGIDTSFLVATLTAAIQEQQQMIETLQAKVAALEAK